MIKTINICDKCKKEVSWLFPYPKLSIAGFRLKIDLKEDSLCRSCLEKLIKSVEDFGKEE